MRARSELFDHADRLVTEDPRRRRLWVAVEECPGIRSADATGLDPQNGPLRIDVWLRRLSDFDQVDPGHERGSHRAAAMPTSCSSSASALRAGQRSRITLESARVIAAGARCMKMVRPAAQPIARACLAHSIR